MIRAFIALDLPDEVRSALAIQQFLLPLPLKVPPEAFHMTLAFLGEVEGTTLEAVHEALCEIKSSAFRLQLSGLGVFGKDRPRAVWVGAVTSVPLMTLQSRIETAVRRAGCKVDHRRFVPHVTLGRFKPPPLAEALRLERAVAEGAAFAPPHVEVNRFWLFESHLGRSGPRYEKLAGYDLISG